MRKLIGKRLCEVAITLFCATLLLFIMTRLAPGDPIDMYFYRGAEFAAVDKTVFDQKKEELRKEYGLDKPLSLQYIQWIAGAARLDFGKSLYTGRDVLSEIGARLPATMLLAITALIMLIVLGLFFGVVSALYSGKLLDMFIRFFCVFFASISGFVIGLGLLAFFSVRFKLYAISSDFKLPRLFLPALIIALTLAPQFIRTVRANMLSELGQVYIVSAQSRGLKSSLIIKHALHNALLPVITLLGLSLSTLIGGSIVIESIFAWPGIGKYALDSIMLHDYPVIQAYAVFITCIVIMVNMTVDILYIIIDPKIRKKGTAFNDAV